jgi:hypothetical protein
MQMPVMAKDVFIGDPYRRFGPLPSSAAFAQHFGNSF